VARDEQKRIKNKKNKNSLKQLSEVAVSLTRRRLVCFSACVKLNSPRNFTPATCVRAIAFSLMYF